MKFAAPLDQAALFATLQSGYSLSPRQLDFLPEGEVGQNYVLTCTGGRLLFLKLLGDSRLAQLSMSDGRLDFYLALNHELVESGLLPQVSRPISTQSGDLKTRFARNWLILYELIPGGNLMERLPYSTEVNSKIARLIARLHNSTLHLKTRIPFIERFGAHFELTLRNDLAALAEVTPRDRPGKISLRDPSPASAGWGTGSTGERPYFLTFCAEAAPASLAAGRQGLACP